MMSFIVCRGGVITCQACRGGVMQCHGVSRRIIMMSLIACRGGVITCQACRGSVVVVSWRVVAMSWRVMVCRGGVMGGQGVGGQGVSWRCRGGVVAVSWRVNTAVSWRAMYVVVCGGVWRRVVAVSCHVIVHIVACTMGVVVVSWRAMHVVVCGGVSWRVVACRCVSLCVILQRGKRVTACRVTGHRGIAWHSSES